MEIAPRTFLPIFLALKRMAVKLASRLPWLQLKRISPFQLFHRFDEDQAGRKSAPSACDRAEGPWPRRRVVPPKRRASYVPRSITGFDLRSPAGNGNSSSTWISR